MKLQLAFCASVSSLVIASTAFPQTSKWVYWQSNGGGCVPISETIKNQQYWTVTGGGRVKYKGDSVQPLSFSCPVNSFNANVINGDSAILRLFYQDSDGAESNFKVEARLLSFAKSNGELKTVCTASSDKKGQWKDSFGRCDTINMDANIYWVEVVIKRTAPTFSGEFNGVSIEGAIM